MNIKYWTGQAMMKYGGSFAKAIGQAIIVADDINYDRLRLAFPELFEKYSDLAANLKSQDDAKP